MKLDLNDGHMQLTVTEQLLSYQKNQFFYFGGEERGSLFIFKDTSAELVNRLIAFCEAEELKIDLSDTIVKNLSLYDKKQKDHKEAISRAEDFKNGAVDQKLFKEHLDFLKKNISRSLLEHQVKASYHLSLLGNGANFSVPGSGKTAVVLSYFEKLKSSKEVDMLVIVGPPACFGPWREEFKEVLGRDPYDQILAGGSQSERKRLYSYPPTESELFLTTFQTLQNDFELMKKMFDLKENRILFVIDEAHYIKQLDGKWANAVLAIAPFAKHRCVLTGTPAPHSYKDLFNLFAFLWQEHTPLTDEDHARLQIYEKSNDYEKAAALLRPKLDPLFYRVRKEDLHLQPQEMRTVNLNMKEIERSIYDLVLGNVRKFSTKDYLMQADIIYELRKARIMRLRQAVSYPKLLSTAIEGYGEDVLSGGDDILKSIINYQDLETPAKLDKLLELVNKYLSENKKVVIWTNFIGTVNLIMNTLNANKVYAKKIVGSTPIEREGLDISNTREKIREEFIDKKSNLHVLVANPAACAESISLHKACSNAIYYDLSFNCAQYLQSLDRIHRVGGSEAVPSYYDFLIYRDTVDENIYINLKNKADRMKNLINQDYSIYSLDFTSELEDMQLDEIIK